MAYGCHKCTELKFDTLDELQRHVKACQGKEKMQAAAKARDKSDKSAREAELVECMGKRKRKLIQAARRQN
jgi:hypothetical protein